MKLENDDVAEVVCGVIEEWFPGYKFVDTRDGTKQCKVVAIEESDIPNCTVYEFRDHNNGQEVLGKFVVDVRVRRVEEVRREAKS